MAKVVTKTPAATKLSAIGLALKAVGINVLMADDTASEAKALADEAKKDETDSGTPYLVFELADGGEIDVDADGFATLDGEQAPAGDHQLTDGNFISIGDDGMLVVTAEEAASDAPEAAPAALSKAEKIKAAKLRAEAVTRGKKVSAALAAQAAKDPKLKQIAALKAQIAELEKEPSTDKAKPKVAGAAEEVDFAKMTQTEKMAHVIKQRYQNKK